MRGDRRVGALFAVAMFLSIAPVGMSSAGAAAGPLCSSFTGAATLTPGLPILGSTQRVKPTVSITGARLSGCHASATSGTVSAKLKFAQSTNCTLLVSQIGRNVAVNARGTLKVTWNNKMTSTIALTMSFGSIPNKGSLATMSGEVTAGLYKGMKQSWIVLWTMRLPDECFGGAPLTSVTFSQFAPVTTK